MPDDPLDFLKSAPPPRSLAGGGMEQSQPKHKLRWYQFSLRTFLIVAMVILLACGWLGSNIARKRAEQRIVKAIEAAGGAVAYEPFGPEWQRTLLGDDLFSQVTSVNFAFQNLDDAQFLAIDLKALPQLRSLNLYATKIHDAGLAKLKELTQLEYLDFSLTAVSDAGLVNLKDLSHLQELNMDAPRLTEAGLKNIKDLTSLRNLDLGHIRMTDAGLENLKGLVQLQHLHLTSRGVTNAGIDDNRRYRPSASTAGYRLRTLPGSLSASCASFIRSFGCI